VHFWLNVTNNLSSVHGRDSIKPSFLCIILSREWKFMSI